MPLSGFWIRKTGVFIRRLFIGLVTGLITGVICAFIAKSISFVSSLRELYPHLVYLLPLGGACIVFIYGIKSDRDDRGANLVLENVRDGSPLPLHKIPEVYCATILSHLLGASVGRFGAGLQISGILSNHLARFFHLSQDDCRIATTCGMGGAFSVMFSSPLAGAFFGMEVPHIGRFHYPSLLPSMVSALSAFLTAQALGMKPFTLISSQLPLFTPRMFVFAFVLSLLGALLSVLYCRLLRFAGSLHKHYADHPYIRTLLCSLLFVLLYVILASERTGGDYYHGSGLDLIPLAVAGNLPRYAFALKILFCTISVAGGFKGGEIGPALFSAASFGHLFSVITHQSPALCAGIMMSAMMTGITNCPVTALFFSLSLYGYHGAPFWLIGVVIGYACSGAGSLYATQRLEHAK